jgi:cell division inhibitor SepF
MGFGRKVGAFLGLVPEDGRHTDQYGDNYSDEFEGAEYAGEFGPDYARDYPGTEYTPSEYAPKEYAGSRSGGSYAAGKYPEPSYPPDRGADRFSSRAGTGFAPEPVVQGALAMQPMPQPRRDPDNKVGNRPVTIKLSGFGEARVIGEKYRDGQAVIMDMTEMADADARRLVDFAAGLAFAKRGSIDKVTTKVFMLLPSDIDPADFSPEQRRAYAGAYTR